MRLFIVYFLVVSLLAGIFIWLGTNSYTTPWIDRTFAGTFLGCIVGLACLLGVVGGLWGKCWLQGIWLASLMACLGLTILFYATPSSSGNPFDWEVFWSFFTVPLAMLALSIPMLAMRVGFGWRLNHSSEAVETQPRIGLEELLLVTSVVASLLFMTRVTQVFWDQTNWEFWGTLGVAVGALSSIAFLTTLPTVFVILGRVRSIEMWFFAWLVFALAAGSVFTVVTVLMDQGLGSSELIVASLLSVASASVFVAGLGVLRLSDLKLVKRSAVRTNSQSPSEASSDPFGIDVAHEDASGGQTMPEPRLNAIGREHRRWVAFTLMIAIASSIMVAGHNSFQLHFDSEMTELALKLRAAGGDLIAKSRSPHSIHLGPGSSDEDLAEIRKYRSLEELSLAGSRVTDDGLALVVDWFPNLQKIDLGHTEISAAGLEHLMHLRQLQSLGLAGTRITFDELQNFLEQRDRPESILEAISELDLSDTAFSPQQLRKLPLTIQSLALRNKHINDDSLHEFLRGRYLNKLDISGNPISGSSLSASPLGSLIANNVPLTDQHATNLVSLREFEFSGTKLTDNSLPHLTVISELAIGDGLITQKGLATHFLNAASATRLSLNSQNFDGSHLPQVRTNIYLIDLSNSGVTDQVLVELGQRWKANLIYVYSIDLSDTAISDIGLQALSGCNIRHLNLSRTNVTAAGIAGLRFNPNTSIIVDFDQFSPNELKVLRKTHRIRVGEGVENPW